MRISTGSLKGRAIKTIEGEGYRPAMSKVRQALFSMLEARGALPSGFRALDLFAGSGSLGFEALSRGAGFVEFVEKDAKAVKNLHENVRRLELERSSVLVREADVFSRLRLGRGGERFDLVFIDPPYGFDFFPKSMRLLIDRGFLKPDAFVTAEIEVGAALPEGVGEPVVDRRYGRTRVLIYGFGTPEADPADEPKTDEPVADASPES